MGAPDLIDKERQPGRNPRLARAVLFSVALVLVACDRQQDAPDAASTYDAASSYDAACAWQPHQGDGTCPDPACGAADCAEGYSCGYFESSCICENHTYVCHSLNADMTPLPADGGMHD